MNRKTRRRPKQETPRLSRQMRQAFAVFIALVMIFDLAFPSASYSEADPTSASGAQDQSSVAAAQDATSSHEQSTAEEDASTADASSTTAQNEADASTSTQEQSASNNSTAQDSSAQSEDAASSSAQEASAASTSSTSSTSEEITADEKSDTKTPAGSLTKSITSADGKHYTVTLEYGANAKIPEGATLSFVEYNKELTEEERAQEANKNRPYASEKFLSEAALEQRSFDVTDALGVSDEDYVFFNKQLKLTLEANGKEIQPAAAVKLTVETDAVPEESSDALVAAVLDAKATKTWQDGAKERAKQREALSPEEQAALPRDPSQIFTTLMATNETKAGEGTKVTFSTTQLGELALVGVAHELVDWESDGMALSVYGALSATVNVNECAAPQTAQDYETLRAFRVDVENMPAYGASVWLKAQPIEGAAHAATSAHVLAGSALGDELFGATGTASPVAFTSGDAFVLTRKLASDDTSTKDAASPIEADKTNESATGAAGQASAVDDKASAADQADALSTTDAEEQKTNSSTASSTTERTISQGSEKNTTATLYNNVSTADGAAYSVTLTYGADAGIPVGSTLEVRELAGSEYRDAQAKTQDALDVSAGQITSLRAFDITILDANGNEFEPLAPVSVSIELEGAEPLGDPSVVHLGELGPEILGAQSSAGQNTHSVEFTTESFSPYTVAYTVSAQANDPICKIYNASEQAEHTFETLGDAVDYAERSMSGNATIEMLTDYTMPGSDVVSIGESDAITLTTASTSAYADGHVPQYTPSVSTATITRGYQGTSMVTAYGSLVLGNITFDGNKNRYSSEERGGIVFVSPTGTLTMSAGTTLQNSKVKNTTNNTGETDYSCGGAVFLNGNKNKHATFTMNGGTITNCSVEKGEKGKNDKPYGGAVYIAGYSTMTMNGGTISNNDASNGGGVYVASNCTFTLAQGTFSACEASSNGGGIYSASKGVVVVKNGSIQSCAAEIGGGIYMNTSDSGNASALTIVRATFSNCTASEDGGGGIYAKASTQVALNGTATTSGDATTYSIVFDTCQATSSNGNNLGRGGAILAFCDATITGARFTACTSCPDANNNGNKVVGGGAIDHESSSLTISTCAFDSCWCGRKGGAVLTNSNTLEVSSSTFTSCHSVAEGGALYNQKYGSVSTLSNCTFTDCYNTMGGKGSGGATAFYSKSVSVEGCTFTNCMGTKEGGAINQWIDKSSNNVDFKVKGCTFTNCGCTGTGKEGGAICSVAKDVTIENSAFTDCYSTTEYGGAVALKTNNGGGNSATVTGCTFTRCTCRKNGGALNIASKTCEIRDSHFYGCTCSDNNGGGVYYDYTSGSLTLSGCEFASDTLEGTVCQSKQAGGGVYVSKAGSTKLTTCTFTSCVAGTAGGAVYVNEAGSAYLASCTISQCKANNGSGGGVCALTVPTVTLVSCGISGCEASSTGGGVFDDKANALTLTSCSISNCMAKSGGDFYGGGGVHCHLNTGTSPTLTLSGTSVTGCKATHASGKGGGVLIESKINNAVVTLEEQGGIPTAISGCAAVHEGGGICVHSEGFTTVMNITGASSVSSASQTKYGAGIYLMGGVHCTMKDSASITDCAATEEAGGIFLDYRNGKGLATLSMEDSSSVSNCSAPVGGGVYVRGDGATTSNFVMSGSASVTGCSASTRAGGVYLAKDGNGTGVMTISGSPSITGNSVTNTNTAQDHGGAGIYVAEGAGLYIQGSPNFGGTNIDSSTGNYREAQISGATNGTESYTKERQDIFLAGYGSSTSIANSLRVNGKITSGKGSIYVWAYQAERYKETKQFGLAVDDAMGLSEDDLASTLSAFRNAQYDSSTGNQYSTYLCGVKGITDTNNIRIVWGVILDGSRRVILRKADSEEFTSLEGAVFTLYQSDKQTVVAGAENLTSDATGVFFVGKLDYGTYYLKETTAPTGYEDISDLWLQLDVSEDGVTYPVKAAA